MPTLLMSGPYRFYFHGREKSHRPIMLHLLMPILQMPWLPHVDDSDCSGYCLPFLRYRNK